MTAQQARNIVKENIYNAIANAARRGLFTLKFEDPDALFVFSVFAKELKEEGYDCYRNQISWHCQNIKETT